MDIHELTKWVVNRGDDLYSLDKQVQFKKKLDKYFEAINYSQCCKSNSEQLPKKLSAAAYTQAISGNYKEFVKWWDSKY